MNLAPETLAGIDSVSLTSPIYALVDDSLRNDWAQRFLGASMRSNARYARTGQSRQSKHLGHLVTIIHTRAAIFASLVPGSNTKFNSSLNKICLDRLDHLAS